jgi:hypothetical protein
MRQPGNQERVIVMNPRCLFLDIGDYSYTKQYKHRPHVSHDNAWAEKLDSDLRNSWFPYNPFNIYLHSRRLVDNTFYHR